MWFSHPAVASRVFKPQTARVLFEALEGRQMLSISPAHHPGPGDGPPPHPPVNETMHAQVLDRITFAETPAAVQAGLNALATAAGMPAFDSTTPVKLDNLEGTSLYCIRVGEEGAAPLRVDVNGDVYTPPAPTDHDDEPTTRPEPTESTFGTIPAAAKAKIQSLADSHGVTETVADDKTVRVLAQPNGITLYTILLEAAGENLAGESITFNLKITVDAAGNPTVLPHRAPPPPSGEGSEEHQHRPPLPPPQENNNEGEAPTGPGPSSNGSNESEPPAPTMAKLSARHLTKAVKAVRAAMNGKLEGLVGAIALFAPREANETVQADLEQIKTDRKALGDAIRALSSEDRKTLRADEKAIRLAIKDLAEALKPLNEALKADIKSWKATLRADKKAIREAGDDADALAAAKAQLATDQADAFAAISADLKAIQDVIDADEAVQAAKAKLASDLPTIAAAQTQLRTDLEKLQNDVQAQLDEAAST